MLVLGIDTSAVTASCAVCELGDNPKVVASGSINVKLTHSQTLLPLMESVMKSADITMDKIDAFAVTNGPGSFTGLRISVAAVKGMAFALGKLCMPVSTLKSLAYNLAGRSCIACCVMDARCNQVYNALFRVSESTNERLTEDRALFIDELKEELLQYKDEQIVLVGDGAELTFSKLHDTNENIVLAPPLLRYQNAVSVCMAADEAVVPKKLMPRYLRLPQAERERLAREAAKA